MADISASVVIPVLNGASVIGDALRALLGQAGMPGKTEIIVVDNGSSDGTQALVQKFPVTLLVTARPGASAARNVGLRAACGEIIAHLDADTLPTRTWLRELIQPFANPAVILVGGQIISFRPETGVERFIDRVGLFRPENNIHNPRVPYVVSANLAVRREAALAIGGWDETLPRVEDVDFSLRLCRRFSTTALYRPEAVLFHRNRRTVGELAAQARGYGHGTALIYRRYPSETRWGPVTQTVALRRIVARSILPELLRLGHFLGLTTEADLEFARYHRLWTNAFWSGFYRTYYRGESKP